MSGSVNKVILIGNMGDDVKLHYFDENSCIGRFPLATNENYTAKDSNERITQTEWHRVVVRNKLAELCEKYLNKGDMIYVEGKLKTRRWDDNGTMRYQTEIRAEAVKFLHLKNNSQMNGKQIEEDKVSNNNNASTNGYPF